MTIIPHVPSHLSQAKWHVFCVRLEYVIIRLIQFLVLQRHVITRPQKYNLNRRVLSVESTERNFYIIVKDLSIFLFTKLNSNLASFVSPPFANRSPDTMAPFSYRSISIPAWISNYSRVCDEITYPFPKPKR